MPMLKVLQYSGMGEIVVAVVRYFGGTKLGTGGLQRAYSDAVSGVLEHLPTRTYVARVVLTLSFDYSLESLVRHILTRYDIQSEEPVYQQQVSLHLAVAEDQTEAFITGLTNQSAGAVNIKRGPI